MPVTALTIIILSDGDASLPATLASIATQTYGEIQCLVGVIGSSQVLPEALGGFAPGIAHWASQPSGSKEDLVELLLPHATGSYIYVMESGWVLHSPEAVAAMLAGNQDADVLYGDLVRKYRGKGRSTSIGKFASSVSAIDLVEPLAELYAGAFVKRELYLSNLYSPHKLTYSTGWFFLLRLAMQVPPATFWYTGVELVDVEVGRLGFIGPLSTANLAQNERLSLLKEHFPALAEKALAYAQPVVQGKLAAVFGQAATAAKYAGRSLRGLLELATYKKLHHSECQRIPIIINNKNHLTYLLRLISSLEKRGYTNLYIIDNNSTYSPLLEYYEHSKYKVFRLEKNVGFCALWDTEIFEQFENQYYVYTDSDLELVEECPDDFMVVMHYLLTKYSLGKVGLSLLIDDLPDWYANRAEVQKWEAAFWFDKVERLAYNARVDTTFALYKPGAFGDARTLSGFRASFPYSARHLPWYENSSALTEEQRYYYEHAATSTHWSKKAVV